MKPLKEVLLEQLSSGKMKIVFTKIDGDRREMICTKNLSLIPTEDHPTSKKIKTDPENIIRVYDLENDGWRSFVVDNIISYEEVA
jgi:hypothetical protein